MHTPHSNSNDKGNPIISKSSSLLETMPPPALILLAVVSIQLGAAVATSLFSVLGAEGTVAIRILLSAVLFLLLMRKRIRILYEAFLNNIPLMIAYGLCVAAMNLFFYKSIALIPLGATVAIEFIGPLGVAAISSRKASHFAWVALAGLGIVLLSPITGVDLDPLGIIFALLAGTGWSLFILLTGRVSKRIPGHNGLIIGMTLAATVMIPFAVPVVGDLIADPLILLTCLAVALLSTALPFTFEFAALKRISNRAYGVLVSVEPAVAALVGTLLLGERIGMQGIIAVTCVVVAAIGITMTDD